MKCYLIFGTSNNGYATHTCGAKNKYEAIKKAREACPYDSYIPVIVKRISKKYLNFIAYIHRMGGGGQ